MLYRYALSFFMEMRPTLLKLKDAVAIESHISSFLLGVGSREVDTLTEVPEFKALVSVLVFWVS